MTRLRVGVLRALPVGVGVFVVFVVVNTLPAVLLGRDVVPADAEHVVREGQPPVHDVHAPAAEPAALRD